MLSARLQGHDGHRLHDFGTPSRLVAVERVDLVGEHHDDVVTAHLLRGGQFRADQEVRRRMRKRLMASACDTAPVGLVDGDLDGRQQLGVVQEFGRVGTGRDVVLALPLGQGVPVDGDNRGDVRPPVADDDALVDRDLGRR